MIREENNSVLCLSGLMGVGMGPRVTGKGRECCWLRRGIAASFLVVLLSSVLISISEEGVINQF